MRYFSFFKNFNDVFITLLVLIFLGAGYFYMYVPQNEKAVQEQRFRSLQNIDKNIHSKIDNSIALMHNLLVAYKTSNRKSIIEYINGYSTANFTLSVPDSQLIKANPDSNFNIVVNNNSRLITLLANIPSGGKQNDSMRYRMEMKFTFEQFIKNLLPANVFDQYIVFSDGQVVYEDFSSGIGFLNDSLSGKKGGIVTSGIKSLNVSGKDYKLFFQPVSFTADKQLVVTGLLSNKHYQQEKNQLPSQGVLLLLTVVFIAIVAYPWIKLYQMGNKDRLTVTDGIATMVVSMLLMSLLFFTLVKYNLFFKPDNSPDSKAAIARQITAAFNNEIDSVYKKIHLYDAMVASDSALLQQDIVYLDKADSITAATGNRKDSFKTIPVIAQNSSINQVYWLDKNGDEKINWINSYKNAPHGNFSQRPYFKNIFQNNSYLLHHSADSPFYLDQVISWTSSAFTSVISIPSVVPGKSVAAMSFNMQSLRQPVLPLGYKFAIIDNKAKVLYHSDAARNLNENLLNELSDNEKLRSCIEARTSDAFGSAYFSREYTVRVQPINNLPYFIVIFSDNSFKETRDVEIYSFTFSMMLLLFLFLVCQLFGVFLVSSHRSFFKRQLFDTSWVGPKISSVNQYNVAALANAIVIILAIVFFNFSSILTYFFILFFSVIFTSLFLNSLFAKRYKKYRQLENYGFKIITIRWLFVFIVLANLGAIRALDTNNFLVFALYELLVFFTGWILLKWGRAIIHFFYSCFNGLFFRGNYAHSFTLMALTRLLLTSGLPMLFFYVTAYNYEQNIGIRYGQLQYASHLPATITESQLIKINNHNNVAGTYYYFDNAWIKNIAYKTVPFARPYSKEDNFTARLLSLFRISISDKAVLEDKMNVHAAADSSFFYNPLFKNGDNDGATVTNITTSRGDSNLSITASSLNYRLPKLYGEKFYNGWLFWICLLLALVIFYFIIYNVLKKLFCLDLPDLSLWGAIDEAILSNEKVNNLLFIIGLPGSGKLSQVLQKIKDGTLGNGDTPFVYNPGNPENNVLIADLINIPDIGNDREKDEAWKVLTDKIASDKNKLIIVNHFEYNIRDAVTNRIKLNLLEQIMLQNTSKVVILSTIHPVAFLDSVMDLAIADKGVPGQDLERWHVLLGHYRIVVFPLQKWDADNTEEVYKTIIKETAQTHFLNKMRESVMGVAEVLPENEKAQKGDELVFKLQVVSHYFYMYIWQSLTKEEKFLLYDLAEDNLVNSFDDYNLNMLLAKGVIIRTDGTLKLFNKGFRNFILTAIGNSEAMKIKNLIKDNGNWSRLKNPLMMVIVAILVFLLISQEEAYSKLITYVATLGAGIPAVIKLFSLFDNNNTKS